MLEIFPIDRASTSSDNVAGHRVEFIEREFRAVGEVVTDLASPTGVGVRGGLVRLFRSGRGGVRVGLCVVVRRKVDE